MEKTSAADEETDATDEALAAEPKKKNPFASMPKSDFDLDDFKRFYSNEDESKSIPYFWQKFDPENYSIWLSEYKYNNELTKVCGRVCLNDVSESAAWNFTINIYTYFIYSGFHVV